MTNNSATNQNPATTSQPDPAQILAKLQSLPALEDTQLQVQAAMDQITHAAGTLIPSITWEQLHGTATVGCGGAKKQAGGEMTYLPDSVAAHVTVTEEDWTTILRAAHDAAATVGATTQQVMQDTPGKHDVWFIDPDTGTTIQVGYHGNLVVSGKTGCRLPRDKK